MALDVDERLATADLLDADADSDWQWLQWVSDLVTERCRAKREQARRLRESVTQEQDVAVIVRDADAELARRAGRRKVA